ncbi:MAG: twin-arginine translocase TatA/TatE family subunit [Acidobacteriota bacterium]
MFGSLGIQEILLILVIALLVFGPKRLPELGKTVGRALSEFRRASSDLRSSLENEVRRIGEEPKKIEPGDSKNHAG